MAAEAADRPVGGALVVRDRAQRAAGGQPARAAGHWALRGAKRAKGIGLPGRQTPKDAQHSPLAPRQPLPAVSSPFASSKIPIDPNIAFTVQVSKDSQP